MPRRPHSRRPAGARGEPALRIVHEDDDLLVVEKPAGLLSATPRGSDEPSLFRAVQAHVGGGPAQRRIWIIHRLDREASGLMVFARSEAAFHWLKEDLRARRVERRYLALVEGVVAEPEGGEGLLQSFLREDRLGHVRSVRAAREPERGPDPRRDEARLAVTAYRVRGRGPTHSLLELRMESGRKHQIRVQLSDLGHPVAGDRRYGARTDPLRRLALHAWVLGLRHPQNGRTLRWESAPPEGFFTAAGLPPPPPARPMEAPPSRRPRRPSRLETSWEPVSPWYEELLEEGRHDHFDRVVLPGTLKLLQARPGEVVLDLACGAGQLLAALEAQGVRTLGVDVSPRMVEAARRRAPRARLEVADARALDGLDLPLADAATCLLALMNMDPLAPILRGLAQRLRRPGRLVGVILHPSFRAPRQTDWEFVDTPQGPRLLRRVAGYLSPGQFEIVMNPGAVARGEPPQKTWTFHRPLQHYVRELAAAGFAVDALEEWPSLRESEGGPRAQEENRARREIPLFLAFRARLGPEAG
jgi:23S rRNA pseudouridine1911/1915/1917 synthase